MSAYTDGCTLYPFADVEGRCDRCGAALTGKRTRWCSAACSASIAENHYWTTARQAARKRDRGRCVRCGALGTEVNHITPRNGQGYGSGCWHHLDGLETLCTPCHRETTNQQAQERRVQKALLADLTDQDRAWLIEHGAKWIPARPKYLSAEWFIEKRSA